MNRLAPILVVLIAIAMPGLAHAAAIITVRQVGPDVVLTGSGTMDITGVSQLLQSNWVLPGNGNTSARVGGGGNAWAFSYATGPSSFGPPGGTSANSVSGDMFGVTPFNGRFFVPADYVSGTPLFGTAIHQNRTLAGMGMDEGIYTFSWGSGANTDTLTVDIAIPEPASMSLLALGGLLLARRRQHRATT